MSAEHPLWLKAFANESNKIEGMNKAKVRELDALAAFLACENKVKVSDLEAYVAIVAPGHRLRREVGLNVRVGHHIAPPGGHKIEIDLAAILESLPWSTPWDTHVAYEKLHPFTDGNGRSGRALWLWHYMHLRGDEVYRPMELGFLHSFYYETLSQSRP